MAGENQHRFVTNAEELLHLVIEMRSWQMLFCHYPSTVNYDLMNNAEAAVDDWLENNAPIPFTLSSAVKEEGEQ